MKYQGVVVLSVRTYLGFYNGTDTWMHRRYAVGIKKDDEKIVDYKTGELYNFVTRDENSCIKLMRKDVEVGKNYAIETITDYFDKNKSYNTKKIDSFIFESQLFSEEYKNYVPVKQKIKEKK